MADRKVWDMTDEFMFGRSILAAPIVEAQYTQERVIREDAMSGWDKKQAVAADAPSARDWKEENRSSYCLTAGDTPLS